MITFRLIPRVAYVLCLMLVASCLFAPSLTSAQEATPEPTRVVQVRLTEYAFTVDSQAANAPLELQTNQPYEIHFKNTGVLTHEVLIGVNPIAIQGGYKHDYAKLLLADVEVTLEGETGTGSFAIGMPGLNEFELSKGQELTINFTLPTEKIGVWDMGCFVSVDPNAPAENPGLGHYDLGMHIPVNIVAGGTS